MNSLQNTINEEKEEILFAAKELLHEKKSYNKIQIHDIVQKTNIPIGKIYSYFNDKDDIFLEIIDLAINEIFLVYDEEVDEKMPLGDKLKSFISLQLEFLGSYLNLIKELLPKGIIPFSKVSLYLLKIRKKYIDFISELFLNNFSRKDFFHKNILVPMLSNSFLAFNVGVFEYWEKDKSEGKQNTLNFIEKGIKNIMVMSVLI